MNKEGYDFLVEAGQFYTFISSGKKGDIAKMVIFQKVAQETYNLVLADYSFESESFSDTVTSDNGDMPKIMATVILIILDFLILIEKLDSFAEYEVGEEHNKFYLYVRQ